MKKTKIVPLRCFFEMQTFEDNIRRASELLQKMIALYLEACRQDLAGKESKQDDSISPYLTEDGASVFWLLEAGMNHLEAEITKHKARRSKKKCK